MNKAAHDFRVIDTDTHVIEPYDLWTSRVSVKKWGDKVPHVKWDPKMNEDAWFFGGDRTGAAAGAAMAGWHEYPPKRPQRLDQVPAQRQHGRAPRPERAAHQHRPER